MKWQLKTYQQLTVNQLYSIVQLRIQVFVVEQNCPYLELDGKDKLAYHFFAFAEENPSQIIAYTRIFKPGDYYNFAAIGRVVVHPDFRGKNLGHELIRKSIQAIEKTFHTKNIKIGAQAYLQKFYENHGFIQVDQPYIEDGIPHIYMVKN